MRSVVICSSGLLPDVRAPHFGQDVCAGSVERVGLLIEGGDVGASEYGADPRTLQLLAPPLPLGTGAVKTVQSLHRIQAS